MAALTLEERVERIEAKSEIADLVTRYGMAVDDRDIEAVAELFTVDGSFGHQDDPGVAGRDAIKRYYRDRLDGLVYSYHFTHNHLIDYDGGDEATGVVSSHAEMGHDGDLKIAAMRYHDTYRRVDGRWCFARRRLAFFYFLPAPDLVAGHYHELRKRWPGEPMMADLPESLDSYREFVSTTSGTTVA